MVSPGEGGGKSALRLPWFVVGFFVLAAINSTGVVPAQVGDGMTTLATGLLVCAVTATGIRSPMQTLLQAGPKPLLIILIASLLALVLACATAAFLLR